MADYILTREAEDDIDGIGLYSFKNWGLKRAESYLKNLDACFESLRDCHRLDRTRDDIKPGLLSRSCQKHVIFFTRDASGRVVILRILGQSMEFQRHLR